MIDIARRVREVIALHLGAADQCLKLAASQATDCE